MRLGSLAGDKSEIGQRPDNFFRSKREKAYGTVFSLLAGCCASLFLCAALCKQEKTVRRANALHDDQGGCVRHAAQAIGLAHFPETHRPGSQVSE